MEKEAHNVQTDLQTSLTDMQKKLSSTQEELESTRASLALTNKALTEAQTSLSQAQFELQESHTKLEDFHSSNKEQNQKLFEELQQVWSDRDAVAREFSLKIQCCCMHSCALCNRCICYVFKVHWKSWFVVIKSCCKRRSSMYSSYRARRGNCSKRYFTAHLTLSWQLLQRIVFQECPLSSLQTYFSKSYCLFCFLRF